MSTLKVNNISNTGGTKSAATDDIADGRCRAWVNFDGTGTTGTNQTIRASFNVSSVYKNGTGDYTVNFTTAMPDVNYCPQVTSTRTTTDVIPSADAVGAYIRSVSSVRIGIHNVTPTASNATHVYVAVFR